MDCRYLKQEEVATRLNISKPAVLRLVIDGKIKPYIYFKGTPAYGVETRGDVLRTDRLFSITGFFYPQLTMGMEEFLVKGLSDEVCRSIWLIPSSECMPEVCEAIDDGLLLYPPLVPFERESDNKIYGKGKDPSVYGIRVMAEQRENRDVSHKYWYEIAQYKNETEVMEAGYPIKLDSFVYLESEVEQCVNKGAVGDASSNGKEGGKKKKHNEALQEAINLIDDSLRSCGVSHITNGTFRAWFDEVGATSKDGSVATPYEFSPPIPRCDELYIDGNTLTWTDNEGKKKAISLSSLQPYFRRAKNR